MNRNAKWDPYGRKFRENSAAMRGVRLERRPGVLSEDEEKRLCAALLPEQVSLDEWGFPVVHNADAPARDVRRAAAACPALALYASSEK